MQKDSDIPPNPFLCYFYINIPTIPTKKVINPKPYHFICGSHNNLMDYATLKRADAELMYALPS